VVDRHITLCDLQGMLDEFVKNLFSDAARTRLRPSYFPFTEPSVEVDVSCFKCGGKGCALCKGTGWIEVLGGGVVNRKVLENCGIDPETGKRADREEYPLTAVREAILNALIHRDYSIHTEGMPIQLLLFEDRFEVRSPGGLYGRLRIDQLGKVQPDTRNPVLAVAIEALGETENRYSGIPTMRRELAQAGMPEPEFRDERGTFVVCFRKGDQTSIQEAAGPAAARDAGTVEEKLLRFCAVPRSRQEIADFLGITSVPYAIKTHVMPLVEQGLIILSLPEKPRSPRQRFTASSSPTSSSR